jgi:hypothetical protein
MTITNPDCNSLQIQSSELLQWYNQQEPLEIAITYNGCDKYAISIPIRLQLTPAVDACVNAVGVYTIDISFSDLLGNVTDYTTGSTITTSVAYVIQSPTVIRFTYITGTTLPVNIVFTYLGNDYTIDFTLSDTTAPNDCSAITTLLLSSFVVTQPALPCGITYDVATDVLEIEYDALIGDCANILDYIFGLYKFDINSGDDTGCIFVDCEETLKCQVAEYVSKCGHSELALFYYIFNEILMMSTGLNQVCVACTDVEDLYKEILALLETPCEELETNCGC